jgi:folate-dependent phosphoribosylglycinamide formyltransferase PurN
MKDFMSTNDEEIRDETLNVKTYPLSMIEEDDREAMEEAHYVHTINAFVELIVIYGWDKVIGDLRTAMGEKQW